MRISLFRMRILVCEVEKWKCACDMRESDEKMLVLLNKFRVLWHFTLAWYNWPHSSKDYNHGCRDPWLKLLCVVTILHSIQLGSDAARHGEKKWGIWEAHSREILICGEKFWNLGGNFAFLYIKTQFKLGKIGLASREINIFSSCAARW